MKNAEEMRTRTKAALRLVELDIIEDDIASAADRGDSECTIKCVCEMNRTALLKAGYHVEHGTTVTTISW